MKEIHELKELQQWIDSSKDQPVVFFKHSNRCPISVAAHEEMQNFTQEKPEIPCIMINVVESKEISNELAELSGVKHESPQVVLYYKKSAIWNTSHREITSEKINNQISEL